MTGEPTTKVRAAGGILARRHDGRPEILLIRRRDAWDLPKGKAKEGESSRRCALREVREELGIDRVTIVEPLGTTRHAYRENGRHRRKTTRWYLMRTDATQFFPQAEERIDAIAWVHPDEAARRLAYESLRELVARHRERLVEGPA